MARVVIFIDMLNYSNRLWGNLRLNSDTVLPGRRCKSTLGGGGKIRWDLEADFDWGPFPRIPNVRKFKITLNEYDELFREHGITKRLPPTLKFEKYNNGDCLRYARYMIQKCRHEKNDRIYWRIVHMLMSRSFVFNMMAVSKCFPRYHRELPLHLVMSWIYGAMKIAAEWSDDLRYKRVYIPKANGKLRPLGVPSPVWRVYMTQLAWFLVLRFNDLIPDWQHGFRPGRGTLTAWRVVLSEVVSAKYIYEFDLKAFFDTVSPAQVLTLLRRNTEDGFARSKRVGGKRVPVWPVFKQLTLLAGTRPEWSESALNDYASMTPEIFEPPKSALGETHKLSFMDMLPDDDGQISPTKKFVELDRLPSLWSVVKEEDVGAPVRLDPAVWTPEPTGFPQGANISPFLSILTMSCGPSPDFARLVMYADDGLFYSDNYFSPSQVEAWFKYVGVALNKEKSGWVRKGRWLRSLQFLGLNYDGVVGSLKSNTRSGVCLEFDKEGLILDLELRDLLSSVPTRSIPGSSELLDYKYNLVSGLGESFEFTTIGEARKAKSLFEASGGGSCNWRISRSDISGEILTRDVDSMSVWERVAKSNVFGLLQSRMYAGEWDPDRVLQSFDYEYISNSWGAKRGILNLSGELLTFANSTSVAFYDIVSLLRKSRTNRSLKRALNRGDMSLAQVNRWRRANGFPELHERSLYLRRYR